jgi:tRNA A-37 threonylcarbamoyl transferase component Bud32/tetratricopeptide (TPR) repeat protein
VARVIAQRFEILRALGEGGMGIVYEAIDRQQGSRIALKTVRHPSPAALARFKREFRALQDLHHPNLVRLGDLVVEDDEWFISMELVQGVDFLTYVGATAAEPRSEESAENALAPTLDSARARPSERSPSGARAAVRSYDERRLRSVLAQLGSGLAALHGAGKVHRDIKPSNVVVSPEGRLVLLDFGLVSDVEGADRSTGRGVVGTPAYMAPEQAASGAIGPMSDLYSVGIMLFEALTGRLPFEGTALQMLMARQQAEPPAPKALVSTTPTDLNDLCVKLVSFDPLHRPSADDLVRLFADGAGASLRVRAGGSTTTYATTFVGRKAELDALASALKGALGGDTVAVLVHGESGVGKSSLVRHFADGLSQTGTLVFAGRCHEREAVPFKAFDGVVESLVRYLTKLSSEGAGRVLPRHLEALTQVFPALRRVPVVTKLERLNLEALDPRELRRRAFAALRETLARIADRDAVVVQIDDMQWADADSLALLASILRPPSPPPILLLMTSRAATLGTTDDGSAFAEVRRIALARLPPEDGRMLAEKLLERVAPDRVASAAQIHAEAGGHPLFIDELVRHASLLADDGGAGAPRLDEALWSRVVHLDPVSRRVLEAVSVAGAPIATKALASAAEVTMTELAQCAAALRIEHLVRSGAVHGVEAIEPYHDRVRDAVVGKLGDDALRGYHERLAVALEATGSGDAESLANHWQGAGDRERAAHLMVRAADVAARALAFDRAATLYRAALDPPVASLNEGTLRAKLGDALANAGRGASAADEYRAAAELAPSRSALELRRLAAEQLLRSGHFDRGLDATEQLLGLIGMSMPRSPVAALVIVLVLRLVVRVRGEKFKLRDPSEIASHDLTRLDLCWSVAFALSHADTIFGYVFGLRYFLLAVKLGEQVRAAKAVALLTGYTGVQGSVASERTRYLRELGRKLADESGAPEALGWWHATAASAHYLAGEFALSLAMSEEGESVFRNRCRGSAWEVSTMHIYTLQSLAQLGRLADLCKRTPAYLREATDLGDLYGAVNMRIGYANLRWLVSDDPDGARRDVGEAMSSWSKRGFHLEHYYELLALTNADLYAGDLPSARSRVETHWGELRRSLLLRVQAIRIQALVMRARVALATAETEAAPPARRRLLAGARGAHAGVVAARAAWAQPLAGLVLAAVERLEGNDAGSLTLLARVGSDFASVGMAAHEVVVRRMRGAVLGGDEGRALVASADEWLASQMVRAPARFAAMIAPGFAERPR